MVSEKRGKGNYKDYIRENPYGKRVYLRKKHSGEENLERNPLDLRGAFDAFDTFTSIFGISLKKKPLRVVIWEITSNASNVSKGRQRWVNRIGKSVFVSRTRGYLPRKNTDVYCGDFKRVPTITFSGMRSNGLRRSTPSDTGETTNHEVGRMKTTRL